MWVNDFIMITSCPRGFTTLTNRNLLGLKETFQIERIRKNLTHKTN